MFLGVFQANVYKPPPPEDIMQYLITVQDTREQRGLFDPSECIISTLKTGDYSILGYESKFAIERKSMIDLVSTVTRHHERFKKEIARGLDMDYFAIVVEDSWINLKNNTYKHANRTKVKGDTVCKIVATIHMKYKVPVFFTKSRQESKELIKYLSEAYYKTQI